MLGLRPGLKGLKNVASKAGFEGAEKSAENLESKSRIFLIQHLSSSTAGKQRSVVLQYILPVHPSDLW